MIRQSNLLKWTHSTNKHASKSSNRNWLHAPDALQRGHIAYLVKFLGNTEVEKAKGIDVVKEGIRKLKFNQQLKRAEGAKTPKVELTISVDGVAIQEPKTKRIMHQYPLHRISYCADDKSDKKFFSFIAKEADADKHTCFVFVSDKLAEEITLTIGQAFDLAYRRFLETSGRDLEMRKQMMILQQRVQSLESENLGLRQRITELQLLKDREDLDNYKQEHRLSDLLVVNGETSPTNNNKVIWQQFTPGAVLPPPPIPPRSLEKRDTTTLLSPSQELLSEMSSPVPVVGTKLENLALDDLDDFDPRGSINGVNGVNGSNHGNFPAANGKQVPVSPISGQEEKDLFGAEPFNPPQTADPFGMGGFAPEETNMGAHELESAIGALDRRLSEMRDGFSRGLSFGNDDFALETMDPLNSKTS